MATYLPVPGTIPNGFCPASWQAVLNQFAALLPIIINGEDEVIIQDDTPGVDDRGKVWVKTLDVAPWVDSIRIWVAEIPPAGDWRPIPGQPVYFVDSGAVNTMVITTGESMNSELFLTGRIFMVKANNTNTGAVTLAVDTVGAKAVKKQNSVDMEAGDFVAGQILLLAFDPVSNVFEVVNTLTPEPTPAPVIIDTTGLTKMIPSVDPIPAPGAAEYVIPHGFGAIPTNVRCVLSCVNPEFGYVTGDEVDVNDITSVYLGVERGRRPFRIACDDENIYIRRHNLVTDLNVLYGPGNAALGEITLTEINWDIKTYAYYMAPKVPSIVTQPTSLSRAAGTNATFTVVAGGDTPLSYQWQRNGVNVFDGGRLSGTGTASLTITGVVDGVPPGGDEANYSCVVTSAIGTISSNTASLTVT
jgi:hypothetical protein